MARQIEVRVPKLGDFSGVPVVEVFISPGSRIAKNDPVVSLESEKAVMEIPSTEAGTVVSVAVKPGDAVSQGDLLGVLLLEETGVAADSSAAVGESGETRVRSGSGDGAGGAATASGGEGGAAGGSAPVPSAASVPPAASSGDEPLPPKGAAPERPVDGATTGVPAGPAGKPHASPSIRRFARELGAPLPEIPGTGPKGRIRREDVQAYVKHSIGIARAAAAAGTAPTGSQPASKQASPDPETFRAFGEIEIVKASRIKRISGPRLAESWRTIPHVTQFDETDITELEAFRLRANGRLESGGVKLTILAFAVRACALALARFPVFNSSLLPGTGEVVLKKYCNIGFAVSTDEGLVVPVIAGADRKTIREIGIALGELSEKARAGRLGPADMSGPTFTISSLGSVGGTAFTPIINPPEVAILGISRASQKPVWDGKREAFAPRLVLPFSLSYDHRAIDGAEGARFCRHFAESMADPAALLV